MAPNDNSRAGMPLAAIAVRVPAPAAGFTEANSAGVAPRPGAAANRGPMPAAVAPISIHANRGVEMCVGGRVLGGCQSGPNQAEPDLHGHDDGHPWPY